jgi:sialidase-1
MKAHTTCMVMVLSCLHSIAAEPELFETTCVYAITPQNKPNYRIPSLIVAPDGSLLVLAEKRNDGPGDIGNHDIVSKRSTDLGKTWSEEQVIFDDEKRVCTDLTVGLDPHNGTLWLFFLRDKKRFACFTSKDSGHTWDGPRDIHSQVTLPQWDQLQGKEPAEVANPKGRMAQWEAGWHQRYGIGPGHAMIHLSSGPKKGRLIVPARHRADVGKGRLRSFSHTFFSDDHGETWKLGGTAGMNTSECQLVELNDGSVRVIARNESSEDAPDNLRHLTAISRDGGETWSTPERQEELITPRCHGSVERYDEKRLLFSSPASPFRQKEHPYGRYNLTVRVSEDEGRTWSAGRTLWPHPGSYSDLAVLPDGTVGCIYERADKGSTHYWDELHFARFNVAWLR